MNRHRRVSVLNVRYPWLSSTIGPSQPAARQPAFWRLSEYPVAPVGLFEGEAPSTGASRLPKDAPLPHWHLPRSRSQSLIGRVSSKPLIDTAARLSSTCTNPPSSPYQPVGG